MKLFSILLICLLFFSATMWQVQASPGASSERPEREVAVFAGGCFWGVDAVFRHVRGVTEVTSGYAGGDASTANYQAVSTGTSGHAESVLVVFDPGMVRYAQLLDIFFHVAHDPTQFDRQGPDVGPQVPLGGLHLVAEAGMRGSRVYQTSDLVEGFPIADRYPCRSSPAILSCRGLSPELSCAASRRALHCHQRSA